MRAAVKIVLSLAFGASVVGCGAVQDAQDAANEVKQVAAQAEACADAPRVIGKLFEIQVLTPSEAVEQAEAKAAELKSIADSTKNAQLETVLNQAAEKLKELPTVKPEEIPTRIQEQVDQIKQVINSCIEQ